MNKDDLLPILRKRQLNILAFSQKSSNFSLQGRVIDNCRVKEAVILIKNLKLDAKSDRWPKFPPLMIAWRRYYSMKIVDLLSKSTDIDSNRKMDGLETVRLKFQDQEEIFVQRSTWLKMLKVWKWMIPIINCFKYYYFQKLKMFLEHI